MDCLILNSCTLIFVHLCFGDHGDFLGYQSDNCNEYYCMFCDKKLSQNVNHIQNHNRNKPH